MAKNLEKYLKHDTRKFEFQIGNPELNAAVSDFYRKKIHQIAIKGLAGSIKNEDFYIEEQYGEHLFGITAIHSIIDSYNSRIVSIVGNIVEHAKNENQGKVLATYIETGKYSEPLGLWILKKILDGMKS